MKILVVNESILHEGIIYKVGNEIDNISDEKAKELCMSGLAEMLTPQNTDFELMTKVELIDYANKNKITVPKNASKSEIIEAINEKI